MSTDTYKCYENYPLWIVVTSNLVSLATYLTGGLIIYQLGLWWLILYLLFILFLELRLLSQHCVDCYYYGKTCSFGKGRLSKLFFKRGQSIKFNHRKMTWRDIIPDFLISIIPIVVGIYILITSFNWLTLLLIVLLFILGFSGSAAVRSQLACKYCQQRKLGCPAQKLFEKNSNQ